MAPRNEDDIDDAIAAELKSLNSEADELEFVGNFERALEVGKKALAIYERELGPDHPEVAGTLGFLAYLYYNLGQFAEAEPIFKRSLAISEKAFGPDSLEVAESLESLARLYRALNREKEAEGLEARASRIRSIKR